MAPSRQRSPKETAIVIGGGIAGLLAARELASAGVKVTLVEKRDHLGGSVGAHRVAGLVLDSGAEAFATRTQDVANLLEELGLADKIVSPNSSGSWLYLPEGAAPAPRTGILGIPGDLRDPSVKNILTHKGMRRAKLDRLLPASAGENAKTLGDLVRVRMGQEVLDRLVAPVVSGVHSMHPNQLELATIAPTLKQKIAQLGSLAAASATLRQASPAGTQVSGIEGGMNVLSEALVDDLRRKRVRILTGFDAIAIDRDPITHDWTLIQRQPEAGEKAAAISGKYLVMASDGATAARLLGPHMPAGLAPSVASSPEIALVTLVVDQPALNSNPRGTGLLVSEEVQTVRAKAMTHASAKWAWVKERAGENRHVVRLSYGRGTDSGPLQEVNLYDDQLITLALHDASKLFDVSLTKSHLVGADVVRWSSAVPTASPGHREKTAAFREGLKNLDGVTAVGAWVAGTGLAAVTRDTRETLQTFISQQRGAAERSADAEKAELADGTPVEAFEEPQN